MSINNSYTQEELDAINGANAEYDICLVFRNAYEGASLIVDASQRNDFAREFLYTKVLPQSYCFLDSDDLARFYEDGDESLRAKLLELTIAYITDAEKVD